MRIADGIEMLEISAAVIGRVNVIHPVLLWDENEAVLVDAGYPGQAALFREAIDKTGISFERLRKVVVTHLDIDHIGSLSAIVGGAAQEIEVLASEAEKPYIQGDIRHLRFTPEAVEAAVKSLPASLPDEARKAFRRVIENPPTAKVDRVVRDEEELTCCGGITIIAVPGHTPGHICVYHKTSKTLIAGDAMWVVDGQLTGPNPQHAFDLEMAVESLKKLAKYDIDAVVCYHGGLFRGDANGRIAGLALGI